MDNDAQTQQLVTTLVVRAATRFAEGKSKHEVIAELEKDGASREVAETIATKGEAIKSLNEEMKKPAVEEKVERIDEGDTSRKKSTGGGWSFKNLFK